MRYSFNSHTVNIAGTFFTVMPRRDTSQRPLLRSFEATVTLFFHTHSLHRANITRPSSGYFAALIQRTLTMCGDVTVVLYAIADIAALGGVIWIWMGDDINWEKM